MSPEEIEWDNGGSAGAAEPFEVPCMVRACESLVITTHGHTPARQIRADVSLQHTDEDARLPQAHLSGDIHSAGSIVFYVLTGGAHAFGKNPLDQQVNIRKGRPDLRSA